MTPIATASPTPAPTATQAASATPSKVSYLVRHDAPASPRLAELMRDLNASTDPTALQAYAETMRSRAADTSAVVGEPRQTSRDILRAAGTAYVAQAGGIGQREALAMLLG